MRDQSDSVDNDHYEGVHMSTMEIVILARKIVKHEAVLMPRLTPWELGELGWWLNNLGEDLL